MSQDLMSEPVVSPSVEANDGKFRPGRTQLQTLLTVLRLAAEYEQWLTLAELAAKTKFPHASISAQLRHLRKPKYGGWLVEKRRREWVREELIWEYRLGNGKQLAPDGISESKGETIGGEDERETGDGV
jgi:hypothetical protein